MTNATNGPMTVTDANFEQQVLHAEAPVLLDFWAEWCGPCRALGPVIESLAEQYSDSITIGKMDVDANQQTAMRYGIRSIPTVILFHKGEIVDSFVGVRPRADYEASIRQLS